MPSVFLDTAFAVALLNERDMYHERAEELAEEVTRERSAVVTTQAVLTEIGNWLAAPDLRHSSVGYIEKLEEDPSVEIMPVGEKLFKLYKERADKAWGLTDCISFVVMRDRGITDALTTDRHFEQAGFNALLR